MPMLVSLSRLLSPSLRAVAGVAPLLAFACATPHMAVAPDLTSATEELPIADRSAMSGALVDESFKLGPYKVTHVDRKWNSTSSSSFGPYSSSGTTGGYTFTLESPAGAPPYQGQCASRKDDKEVSVFGGSFGKQNYGILCHCAGATQAGFDMKADTTAKFAGSLQTSQGAYALAGVYTNDKGGSVSDPLGYEIRGAAPLGAVETTGTGRAWMSRAVASPVREEAACLFAGLLLYKAPQQAFEK